MTIGPLVFFWVGGGGGGYFLGGISSSVNV